MVGDLNAIFIKVDGREAEHIVKLDLDAVIATCEYTTDGKIEGKYFPTGGK